MDGPVKNTEKEELQVDTIPNPSADESEDNEADISGKNSENLNSSCLDAEKKMASEDAEEVLGEPPVNPSPDEPEDGGSENPTGSPEENSGEFKGTPDPEEPADLLSEKIDNETVEFNPNQADQYYDDQLNEMTYGRRLARYWATRYDCYDPSKKKEGDIKLDAAWAYFEHSALARHFLQDSAASVEIPQGTRSRSFLSRTNEKDQLIRAEYGEREVKTQLYSFLKTPERELGDFGLGVGLYFWTLKVLAIICLIAGFLSIPNMIYFNSSEYDSGDRSSVPFGLGNAAICTDTDWVPCPTCKKSDWKFPRYNTVRRYATATSDESLIFALRNNCNINHTEAAWAFATLIFVVVSVIIMSLVSRRREVRLDESQQTTTDYSIEVTNPPPDAVNPEEWNLFFSQFDGAQVVAVTVALDNEELIRTLVKRRKLIRSIKALLKDGVKFDQDNLNEMVAQCEDAPTWKKYLLFASDAKTYLERVKALEKEVQELTEKDSSVNCVFCTFQTEQNQRAVLTTLSTSGYERTCGSRSIPDAFKFRGEHVLHVAEPKEPSAVIWHNLDTKASIFIIQVIVAFVVVFVAIGLGAFLIYLAGNKGSALWTTVTITAINQVVPRICKFINNLEAHKANGSREASLYVKMTLFKWINTAIITNIIYPFVATIDGGPETLTRVVKSIFIAELVTNPSLLLLDIWGQIQRHYLGPRANSQERMNLRFRGARFSLALRYTEVTKILFLTFFYSALYPGGFFFAAASLTINYFVDKFSLLRTCGQTPAMGNAIAQFSRSYLFPAAFAIYAVMLAYSYSGWPYDNLCNDTNQSIEKYLNVKTISISGEPSMEETVSVSTNDMAYQYCLQDMLHSTHGVKFPPLPKFQELKWMTDSQEGALRLLGWGSVGILVLTAVVFLRKLYVQTIRKFIIDTYRPTGKSSEERFLDLKNHYGYIPSVDDPTFEYPLLACNISGFGEEFLSWSDPSIEYPYDKHNLIYDMPSLANDDKQIFLIVKSWMATEAEGVEGVASNILR